MKKNFYDQLLIEPEPLMTKRQLKRQIEKKLDQLSQLLVEISEAQTINSADPDTWDSDTLYNLVENCQEVIQLLGDQATEDELCSLVDEYHEEEEDY